MKFRQMDGTEEEHIYVLILDDQEEAFSAITRFATDQDLSAASVTAIGAFGRATVGWFDFTDRSYHKIPIEEQCEVLSLMGDIAVGDDGRASLHLHTVLGLKDGTTRGGHFLEGIVHPTLEVMIAETPAELRRRRHEDLGIALIDL